MNQRRHVTLVAAASTLLATAPLSTVFMAWTWSVDCLFVVAAICAAALGTRAVRSPLWAQLLAMFGALIVMVTWLFGKGALLGTIPTGTTLTHFGDLLVTAGHDISDYGVPVPDRDGLLFLTTLSVGLVAILVDLVAVSLRRPALAGFPMLAMYWIPVLVHPDSVSLVPFVVGAVGFLWLLVTDNVDRVRRFGRRFTGEGRDVDVWEPSPLAAAGRRLAVVGVVLAVLLPLAVPGMTSGLLDRFGTNGDGGGIGPGNGQGGATVNLFSALAGQLNNQRQTDMLKVTTTDPNPYYLRFGVADRISADGFSARNPADGRTATGPLPDPTLTTSGVTQHRGTATVQILGLQMPLLPVYAQPTRIQRLDGSWLYDQGSGLLYSNRQNSAGKTYTFEYVRSDFSSLALRAAKPLSDSDELQRLDTQVIDVPQVDTLVEQLTKGKTNQYDKVRALFDYFSAANHFIYALTTKTGTTGSDIADFLVNKQGYCEQYASALAWLVRAAHIPARVAFGFTRGGNRDKDTYTLTNYNLHAWTEVYFQGFGWVPFDATPVSALAGAVSPPWAPDVNHTDDTTNAGTPSVNSSTGPGGNLGGQDPNGGEGSSTLHGGAGGTRQPIWLYWTLGSAVLILLLLAVPAMRRAAVRRRRRPRALPARAVGSPEVSGAVEVTGQMRVIDGPTDLEAARADAHAAWDELVDTLVDYRIPLDDSETPRVTADRIATILRLRPEAADGVRRLGQAEERARYARVPLPPGGLSAAIRSVRSAIAGRATRWTRIRAVLLPPSVLQRWGTGLVEAVSGTVAAVGRRRDALLRAIRPRRFLLIGRANRS